MPKISGLPTATVVSPSDFLVVVDNAAIPETKKVTANLLSTLAPVQTVAGRIGAVVLSSSDVGLDNVNNTADADKPVSTAQSTADTAVQNYAVQRANHTGTQNAATISDFATAAALYGPVTSVAGKTGAVTIGTADVSGLDTLLAKTVYSDNAGISGATAILNIVTLTQAAYDAIVTPQPTTLYVIRDV
jgi:hypothetical protein